MGNQGSYSGLDICNKEFVFNMSSWYLKTERKMREGNIKTDLC